MEKILKRVYASKGVKSALSVLSYISVALSVIAFAFAFGYKIYLGRYTETAILCACALIGFIAVTLARKLINAPRPYELYSFYEVKPKSKKGSSFPSRHAYSAFVIATLSIALSPYLAIALYIFAFVLIVCRVLLGIHFVRDVLAGALLGVISGAVGLLITQI